MIGVQSSWVPDAIDDLREDYVWLLQRCPVEVETVVVARQWVEDARALVTRLMSDIEEIERILDAHRIPGGQLSTPQRVELLIERYYGAHITRMPTPPNGMQAVTTDDVIEALLWDHNEEN